MDNLPETMIVAGAILISTLIFLQLGGFPLMGMEKSKYTETVYSEPTPGMQQEEASTVKKDYGFQSFSGHVILSGTSDFYMKYADTLTQTYKTVHVYVDSETYIYVLSKGARGSFADIQIGNEVVVTPSKVIGDSTLIAGYIDVFG